MKAWPVLLVSCVGILLGAGTQLADIDSEHLQKEFDLEQAKIDLALAQLALEAASGVTSPEETQIKVHDWLKANAERLFKQAERGAQLDTVFPLPPESSPEGFSLYPAGAVGERLAELDEIEARKRAEIGAQTSSPEKFIELFDHWHKSEEGKSVFQERSNLMARLPQARPDGAFSGRQELPENASATEKEIFRIEERMAGRLHEIRVQNPGADPEAMQRLVDEVKEDIDADYREIGKLMEVQRKESLGAEIFGLESKIGDLQNLLRQQ